MNKNEMFPLGILSRNQIAKGEAVLEKIANAIGENVDDIKNYEKLSSEFYCMIPHIKLKVINTRELVSEKKELLENMKTYTRD